MPSEYATGTHALPRHFGPKKGGPVGLLADSTKRATETQKMLLVDDNADLLDLSRVLFERRGFEVLTATSGNQALEILRQVPDVDALVTDMVMTGMSGLELGHAARGLLPQIKVVLVSGFPNPAAYAGQCHLRDFDFLSKPYRTDDVLRLLGILD